VRYSLAPLRSFRTIVRFKPYKPVIQIFLRIHEVIAELFLLDLRFEAERL
jgi:hypothetical protein